MEPVAAVFGLQPWSALNLLQSALHFVPDIIRVIVERFGRILRLAGKMMHQSL